jgi:hypothetical protein
MAKKSPEEAVGVALIEVVRMPIEVVSRQYIGCKFLIASLHKFFGFLFDALALSLQKKGF